MKKHFLLSGGTALALALTGCGGSSDESGGSGSQSFSIDSYTPLANSSSLEGTWVGVNNYSISGERDGVVGTETVSQKRFFIIYNDTSNDELYFTSCDTDSSQLINQFGNGEPEMFGEQLTINDNNSMSVTVDYSTRSETWNFVKVSNNNESMGTVAVDFSGNTTDSDTSYDALALCEKYVTETGGGFTEIGHYLEFGMASAILESDDFATAHEFEAYQDLVDDGYDFINSHVGSRSMSVSQAGEESVSISVGENTNTSLIGSFSGTDNFNSISFVYDVNISIASQ